MTNLEFLKDPTIRIGLDDEAIRLGSRHAVAVCSGETITWTCEEAFAIHFPPGSPFELLQKDERTVQLKMPEHAVWYHPYKYTIAVYHAAKRKVLVLDPVLVNIPPRG